MVRFNQPGISYIFCNIHPQMSAVMITLTTPLYAISNADGQIALTGVPYGRYKMHVWSEGVGPGKRAAIHARNHDRREFLLAGSDSSSTGERSSYHSIRTNMDASMTSQRPTVRFTSSNARSLAILLSRAAFAIYISFQLHFEHLSISNRLHQMFLRVCSTDRR